MARGTVRFHRDPGMGRRTAACRRRPRGHLLSAPVLHSAPVLLAASLLLACSGGGDPGGEGASGTDRPVVLVSVPPQAWLVERLVGGSVDVEVMVPPGASPALYEPTLAQMRRVARAELYLTVGHPRFPFERSWLGTLTEGRPALRVVPGGSGCRMLEEDPHLWLSTRCVRRMVDTATAALVRLLPDRAAGIEARRDSLEAVVSDVERRLHTLLEPHRGRAFLVFHPALGYLAADFGLVQMAIEEGGREPSPGRLAALVQEARERGIRTVFVQPQFSREAARTVARELDGKVRVVDPLARDWERGMVALGRALADAFAARGG